MVSKLNSPRKRLVLTQENVEEKFINIDGGTIRYVVAGSSTPLLLIHGFGAFLEVWWLNIGSLSKHYRVYALDLPGHGLSDRFTDYNITDLAKVIVRYMDAVGIKCANVLGHSMGGLISAAMAVDFPERVSKLIIEDGVGPVKGIPLRYRFFSIPILGEMLLLPTTRANVERGLKKSFYNAKTVTQEMVEASYQFLKLPGAKKAMLSIIRSGRKFRRLHSEVDMLNKISMIKAPTLVIHGAQDRTVPLAHALRTWSIISGAEFKVFEECGHCPHIEKASDFNRAVIDFFNGESLVKEV